MTQLVAPLRNKKETTESDVKRIKKKKIGTLKINDKGLSGYIRILIEMRLFAVIRS